MKSSNIKSTAPPERKQPETAERKEVEKLNRDACMSHNYYTSYCCKDCTLIGPDFFQVHTSTGSVQSVLDFSLDL